MPSVSRLALPLVLLLPVFTSAAAVPGAPGVQPAGHGTPGGVAMPQGASNDAASKIQNAIDRITAVAGPGAVPPKLEALLQQFEGGAGSAGPGSVGASPPFVGPAGVPSSQVSSPSIKGANTQAGVVSPKKGTSSVGGTHGSSNAIPPTAPGVPGTGASTYGPNSSANNAASPGVTPSMKGSPIPAAPGVPGTNVSTPSVNVNANNAAMPPPKGGVSAGSAPAAASPWTGGSAQSSLSSAPRQGPSQMQRRQNVASVLEGIINKISSIAGPDAVPPQLDALLQQLEGGAPAGAAPVASGPVASVPPSNDSHMASGVAPSQAQVAPSSAPSSQVGATAGPTPQRRQDIASVIQDVINKITSIAGPGAVPANLQALLQKFEGAGQAGAMPPSASGAVPPSQGNAAPAGPASVSVSAVPSSVSAVAASAGGQPTVGSPATSSQMQKRENYNIADVLEDIVNTIVGIVGPSAIPPQLQAFIQQLEGGASPVGASPPIVGPAGVPGANSTMGSNSTASGDPNADVNSGTALPSPNVPSSQAPGGVPLVQAANGASSEQNASAGSAAPNVTPATGVSASASSPSSGPTPAPGPSKRMFERDDDGFAGLFNGGFASIASDFIDALPSDVAAPVKSLESEFIASSSASSTSTSSTTSASSSATSSTTPSPTGNSAVGRLNVSTFSIAGAIAVLGSMLLGSAIAL